MKSENMVLKTFFTRVTRDDTKASTWNLVLGEGRPCHVRTLCACLRSLEAASWLPLACSWCQDVPGTNICRMPKVSLHVGWSTIWQDFEQTRDHQNSRPRWRLRQQVKASNWSCPLPPWFWVWSLCAAAGDGLQIKLRGKVHTGDRLNFVILDMGQLGYRWDWVNLHFCSVYQKISLSIYFPFFLPLFLAFCVSIHLSRRSMCLFWSIYLYLI